MPTTASDFLLLQRSFERFNRRQTPGRIFRQSIRRNDRLRRLSRQNPLGRAGVNTASILGEAFIEQIFDGGLFDINGSSQNTRGGTNTASGLGDIFSNSSVQLGLINVFSNLLEGLFNDALSSTRTRTTVSESQRSQEFASRWNLSRSQQDAELAAIVQRGLGQL